MIAGDGIGQEVIPAGIAVVKKAAAVCGAAVEFVEFPWGCDFYRRHGRMMDEDGFDRLQEFDAIYLGAIGDPSVPDHISVWQLILPIRQRFDQYVNLRPMRLVAGVTTPLAGRGPADIDMVCVRENSEGEYAGIGGRLHAGTPHDIAQQVSVFTRRGIERIARYAFETAMKRPRKLLASATKSNALQYSMVLWDEVLDQVAKDYPSVSWRKYHVDALAARMVTDPASIDVIVASNLFGDILTDLGAAVSGSLGIAPSGEHQSRAEASVDVRADPRIGARHRGQGDREPDRRDLGGRADARSPRRARRARSHRRRDRARAGRQRAAHAGSRREGRDPRRDRRHPSEELK